MDVRKLIEEGARVLADIIAERHDQVAGGINWMNDARRNEARAVIAITLKAAADEAENCHPEAPTRQQHETSEHIALHLRALAEQLEKSNG